MSEDKTGTVRTTAFSNRIIWIFAVFMFFMIVGSLLASIGNGLVSSLITVPAEYAFINKSYMKQIFSVLLFFLVTALIRKNRFIFDDVNPLAKNNRFSLFLAGFGLGFAANALCVLCAYLHGDIKLVFDFSFRQIPFFIYALIGVFFQSSSEELWARGFLNKRVNVHYPLWVAYLVNCVVFGLLHAMNPGFSAVSLMHLVADAFAYSLGYTLTGSIWFPAGMHTAWNYTQNLIFGLPNSGLVSEASIFRLAAASGERNLIYDYVFGVEGGLPSVIIPVIMAAVMLWMMKKQNRLDELKQSRESLGLD